MLSSAGKIATKSLMIRRPPTRCVDDRLLTAGNVPGHAEPALGALNLLSLPCGS